MGLYETEHIPPWKFCKATLGSYFFWPPHPAAQGAEKPHDLRYKAKTVLLPFFFFNFWKTFTSVLDTTIHILSTEQTMQPKQPILKAERGIQESQLHTSRPLLFATSTTGHAGSPCLVIGYITDCVEILEPGNHTACSCQQPHWHGFGIFITVQSCLSQL